jgi:hypothetical protein
MTPNQLSIKIGLALKSSSDKFIQQGFHLNPKVFDYDNITKFLLKFHTFDVSLMDNKYWIESYENWKEMLDICWIKEREYAKERFDCDNFAQQFQAWASWYFDLNTAGRVFGGAFKLDGTPLENHYWSAILTKDKNDLLHLCMIEPQNMAIVEYQGEKEFILGNMRVKPTKIYFG